MELKKDKLRLEELLELKNKELERVRNEFETQLKTSEKESDKKLKELKFALQET